MIMQERLLVSLCAALALALRRRLTDAERAAADRAAALLADGATPDVATGALLVEVPLSWHVAWPLVAQVQAVTRAEARLTSTPESQRAAMDRLEALTAALTEELRAAGVDVAARQGDIEDAALDICLGGWPWRVARSLAVRLGIPAEVAGGAIARAMDTINEEVRYV